MTESLTGQGSPSYTGIRDMLGPATIAETGVSPGANVAQLEKRVADLSAQTTKTDRISQARRDIEAEKGAPAEGIDQDPRYFRIQEKLKEEWLAGHPGKDLLSEEGQNYTLGFIDPKQEGPTLKKDADRLFREEYPEDAKEYDAKEQTRIYEESNQDPAIKKVEQDILTATNLDPEVRQAMNGTDANKYREVYFAVNAREYRNAWDAFIRRFPEKARAYGERGRSEINEALQRQERLRQDQAKKAESLAQERVETQTETAPAEEKAAEAQAQGQQEQTAEVDSKVAQKTASEKPREVKILSTVRRNKDFQAIYQELYTKAKLEGKVDEPLITEQALKNYCTKLAKGVIRVNDGVPKTIMDDYLFRSEWNRLKAIAETKEGETPDLDVLNEQALSNYLRAEINIPDKVKSDPEFRAVRNELLAQVKKQGEEVDITLITEEALKKYYKKKFKGILVAVAVNILGSLVSAGWDTAQKTAQPAR